MLMSSGGRTLWQMRQASNCLLLRVDFPPLLLLLLLLVLVPEAPGPSCSAAAAAAASFWVLNRSQPLSGLCSLTRWITGSRRNSCSTWSTV
jgi:hypothetical protein